MQELWVIWVAGVALIGLSVVAKMLAARFGRHKRTTHQAFDPLGIFESADARAWLNILVGIHRVMGIFFLAVGVTVSAIAAALPG